MKAPFLSNPDRRVPSAPFAGRDDITGEPHVLMSFERRLRTFSTLCTIL